MAIIAAPSSSNNSSTLPTISISFYPSKSCSQSFCFPSSYLNSIKLVPPAAAFAALTAPAEVAPIDDAAAFEAARVAVFSACEMENFLEFERSDDDEEEDGRAGGWRNGMFVRRKRRRKRRKGMDKFEGEMEIKNVSSLKPANDGRFLSRKAEADYSFCIKEEARIQDLRKSIEQNGGRKLTLAEWAKAAGMSRFSLDKILCNGREAQERIIRCYKRLVVSVAYSYQGRGLSLEDLIQEGSLGLLHGAKKFNPEKGYKLSTYVYWWIRQAISRAIAKKSKMTRLPGSITELVPRICEANAVLSRKLHQWPTREEVAAVVNKDSLMVSIALGRNRQPVSMDHTSSDASRMSLQDVIAGPKETTPEELVKKQFMKRDLEELLNGICDSREVHILKLHYGLNGDAPLSFEEIGKQFRLSRERVRQINCIAMSKLRQATNVGDFKVYIE